MPTYRSIGTSVGYHHVTRPLITMMKRASDRALKPIRDKMIRRFPRAAYNLGLKIGNQSSSQRKAAIRKAIYGRYSKLTPKGRQARAALAANVKAARATGIGRKPRTYQGAPAPQTPRPATPRPAPRPTAPPRPAPARPSTPKRRPAKGGTSGAKIYQRYGGGIGNVHSAVSTSSTAGQLRRKLTGMAVRKTTRHIAASQRKSNAPMTRKQIAQHVRRFRKGGGTAKGTIAGYRRQFAEQAAKVVHSRK